MGEPVKDKTFKKNVEEAAHEIKNQLAIISANVQMLELSDTLPENGKYYVTVHEQLDKMNHVLERLTKESVEMENAFQTLDISMLIENVIDSMNPYFHTNRIITRHQMGEPLYVYGKWDKLTEAVQNILKNAVEAMQNGGAITIKEVEQGKEAVIYFEDEGEGLPEDYEIRSIEPHFTTKANGGGIGLRTVKATMCEHQGRFVIENRKEGGCRVRLSFPLKKSGCEGE